MPNPPPATPPSSVPQADDAAAESAAVAQFIQKWQAIQACEIATSQSFINDLCALLGVQPPTHQPEYQFERSITQLHGDGSSSPRRADCYKRGHFVWESKKFNFGPTRPKAGEPAGTETPRPGARVSGRFDDAMLKARQQAEDYARALPASEGRPPFVVVADVGHVIELYAEFTRSGGTYTPFPDARSHRIPLPALADPAVRARLRLLWTDPLALDPARASAKVTRAVSKELAELAKSLEEAGHDPQAVAGFLVRCLFSMFAEDVGLLPKPRAVPGAEPAADASAGGTGIFSQLLRSYREDPETLQLMLRAFWRGLDEGGFIPAVAAKVLRFNGKVFKGGAAEDYVLPLTTTQVDGLLRAARANWQEVEPAIFGTLLERALDTEERHALGAHYTPRAYVERLVLPTVVEPLRADWADALAAAALLQRQAEAGKPEDRKKTLEEARGHIRSFHRQLCATRVLDPACGSGNFLYVTLEHLKRLEGEVLDQLEQMGEQIQGRLGFEGDTVRVAQLLGIELSPKAAALAELVLWIGWLQWHVRTVGVGGVLEPVVHDYGNIECRDAVLAYDRQEIASGPDGKPLLRWDGKTKKRHPVTGEEVPDETALVPQWRYVNPRPAVWPKAEFIVGNPPFIGAKFMRDALGDGYAEALRGTRQVVPESADFVMYWWHHAAEVVRAGRARRFGFITTNSLRQTFNRRVVEAQIGAEKSPLTLAFAVPDHPWVDSGEGAAVRIAMTVGTAVPEAGRLVTVTSEAAAGEGEVAVVLQERRGVVHSDLRIGANTADAQPLRSNAGISSPGVKLHGAGFIVTRAEAAALGLGEIEGLESHIREYRNGRDLNDRPRDVLVIDLFGLTAEEVRSRFPAVFQWVLERVKPERDANNRATYRENWWTFGEARSEFRPAIEGLRRYCATVVTSKHRLFQFLDDDITPDDALIVIASADALSLGVLSSSIHCDWALRTGSTLEDRPRYIKSRCFEPFPFPHEDTGLNPALADRIRQLAEQLDAHRKARQAAHEAVTLTGLYNVLDKLRRGEPLNAKDKLLHEQGLVSVLHSLHEELDAAVLQAYGWADLGPVPWRDDAARAAWTETLLERLVALNARRAAEEAAGTVRWLRPEFQDPARRAAAAAAAQEAAAASAPRQAGIEGLESAEAAQAARAAQAAEAASAASSASAASDDPPAATPAGKPAAAAAQPWPAQLPEQMRAVAQLLAASPAPLPLPAIEAAFKGKGPWKKGLPRILETLEALGRARFDAVAAGWRA